LHLTTCGTGFYSFCVRRRAVVVVDAEEWERKTRRIGNLAEFFAASPLRGSGLKADDRRTGCAQRTCEFSS
jgi:hypothetical protein